MQLDVVVESFLRKYHHRFINRAFIIDLMCQVHPNSRNVFVLSNKEYKTLLSSQILYFKLSDIPEDLHYETPYNLNEIKDFEPELVKSLDEIHLWRANTGLELLHREPTLKEFIRTWRNWQCMTPDQKEESDTQARAFQGMDNTSFFETVFTNYYQTRDEKKITLGDIWYAFNQETTEGCFVYVDEINGTTSLKLQFLHKDVPRRLVSEIDTVHIDGMTDLSYPDDIKITTVGRVLLNYLLSDAPFQKKTIPFRNTPWDIGQHHDILAKAMLAPKDPLPVAEFKRYADNFFFIGSFTELCVPAASKKSLTTDPNMKQLKEQLYLANKEKIDAGDPIAIAELENALIAADKAWLKGDISMRFYGPLGAKPFDIARKKSYLTIGGIEDFTKHGGTYNYIDCSLAEGWNPANLPAITNEIRSGSYKRGKQTARGGYGSKMLIRAFQDCVIKEDDCGTLEGLPIDFNIVNISDFIGRFVKVSDDKWAQITRENLEKFNHTKQILRSPQHCHTKNGLCYQCCGQTFADLEVGHVAMLLTEITARLLTLSLKAMHGTKISVYTIDSLDQFIV